MKFREDFINEFPRQMSREESFFCNPFYLCLLFFVITLYITKYFLFLFFFVAVEYRKLVNFDECYFKNDLTNFIERLFLWIEWMIFDENFSVSVIKRDQILKPGKRRVSKTFFSVNLNSILRNNIRYSKLKKE